MTKKRALKNMEGLFSPDVFRACFQISVLSFFSQRRPEQFPAAIRRSGEYSLSYSFYTFSFRIKEVTAIVKDLKKNGKEKKKNTEKKTELKAVMINFPVDQYAVLKANADRAGIHFGTYVKQLCMKVIPSAKPDPALFVLSETLGLIMDRGEGSDGVVTVGTRHYAEPQLVIELLQAPRGKDSRMEKTEAERLVREHTAIVNSGGKQYVDIETTLAFLPALYAAERQKGG